MAEISASMVMDLRQRTGLGHDGMQEGADEAGGDPAKAEELLRIRSGAKASKAASRIAAEGVIGLFVAPDARTAAMVEVNCETDFVAKNEDFRAFASEVAALVARDDPADAAALGAKTLASGRDCGIAPYGARAEDRREHVDPPLCPRGREGPHRLVCARRQDRRPRRRDRRPGHARQGSRDARRREQAEAGPAEQVPAD
jgi:hypothetical protein